MRRLWSPLAFNYRAIRLPRSWICRLFGAHLDTGQCWPRRCRFCATRKP